MIRSLSPERWLHAQHLFDEVVDLDPSARTAHLDEACRDDPSLRQAVEMLLDADLNADDRLQHFDRLALASPLLAEASPSRTGSTVAHYEVLEKLGSGGMGVVYKALDSGLKRTVALKFLPPHLHANPAARQRFEHEAQAASALDHTNICTIYEIGEVGDGQSFIAMACYERLTDERPFKGDGHLRDLARSAQADDRATERSAAGGGAGRRAVFAEGQGAAVRDGVGVVG